MKLYVNDVGYDIISSLQNSAIGDLLKLKVKTKTADFNGVTIKFIQNAFSTVGERMSDPEFDPVELLGDENYLNAMAGLIFLARRNSGEQLEVSDAFDTNFANFRIEPDPEDEAAEDGPKESGAAESDAPS